MNCIKSDTKRNIDHIFFTNKTFLYITYLVVFPCKYCFVIFRKIIYPIRNNNVERCKYAV